MAGNGIKRNLDWELIEAEYRAGVKSMQEIADEHGISKGAIGNKAKKFDWVRDLSAKVKAKAEALVNESLMNESVNTKRKFTEKEVIESAAVRQKEGLLKETKEITELEKLIDKLIKRIDTVNPDAVESLSDLVKLSQSSKYAVDSKEKVINLRRRNLGINDNSNGEADKPIQSAVVTYV